MADTGSIILGLRLRGDVGRLQRDICCKNIQERLKPPKRDCALRAVNTTTGVAGGIDMLPIAETALKADTATAAASHSEETGKSYSPRHLTSVDALRGIAAITVVLFHIVMAPSPNLVTPHWVQPLIISGKTGVTMFFWLAHSP